MLIEIKRVDGSNYESLAGRLHVFVISVPAGKNILGNAGHVQERLKKAGVDEDTSECIAKLASLGNEVMYDTSTDTFTIQRPFPSEG